MEALTEQSTTSRLHADALTLVYDGRTVAEDLGVVIADRSFTVIVGPNACGKTTLLRAPRECSNPDRVRCSSTAR